MTERDDRAPIDPATMQEVLRQRFTRRSMLKGAGMGIAGFSVASFLAACSGDGGGGSTDPTVVFGGKPGNNVKFANWPGEIRDVLVAQHLELSPVERFDLVIGTNVFVYYDRPEQALAMANLATMVKPGGILLSNNALLELPSTGWRSIGYSKTLYSDRDEDGDTVVWYQLVVGSR